MLSEEMRTYTSSTTLNKKPTEDACLMSREAVLSCLSLKCQTCMPPRDAVPIRKDLARPL